MVITGNSGFYIAEYTETEVSGEIQVSYSGFLRAAKAVRFTLTPNEATDNEFIADNGVDEIDNTPSDANVEMEVNGLNQAASKSLLGLVEEDLPVIEGITDTAKVLVYDDRMRNTPKGMATIIEHQEKGVRSYEVVLLPKVQFAIPAKAATTRGRTITWQTRTVTGRAMRGAANYHRWQERVTFTTESQAIKYIRYRFQADAAAAQAQGDEAAQGQGNGGN
jgi:hypothetical protein